MVQIDTGQLWGQGCALGLLAGFFGWGGRRRQALEFLLNGGDVGVYGFIEQTGLGGVELFAAAPKLPALEHGHLMCELVDLGLAIHDLAILAGDGLAQTGDLLVALADLQFAFTDAQLTRTDGLVPISDLCNQITGEFAQLLCVQTGQ